MKFFFFFSLFKQEKAERENADTTCYLPTFAITYSVSVAL